ncbi:MAG TPA: heparan-alpha-glucosaminide N-acetyltransferase domain-containing protein, partial [Kofleriaceae bacterium]|nr:heparan-alpha-glucosaminide N-acetyltransferase domain-containing protein [Kofleriaceae bacterium]
SPAPRIRLESIDVVRGIIMIVMALDHVRDFLGPRANPTNLATTTTALFFTRWITHFCAPVFCLLTGVAARLALGRRSPRELSRLLWTRGLWLIALDTVVLRCLAYQFNVDFQFTVLLVLWSLGWSMITLAALVYLPSAAIVAVGALLVAGHNLLDGVTPGALGALAPVWRILHVPGPLTAGSSSPVFVSYPLIPWIGVMALGFGLGAIYAWPAERRRALLLRTGLALIAAFVVLRAHDGYGDPSPWTAQRTGWFTVLSFLNTTKYPPSLLFLLMTLGPTLLALRAAEATLPRWLAPARIIGQVPLFYYAVHFALIHLLAVVVSAVQFGSVRNMFDSPSIARYPATFPPGWGFGLPGVYAAWIAVVVAMYPVCRWYAAVKQRRRDWWLSYL